MPPRARDRRLVESWEDELDGRGRVYRLNADGVNLAKHWLSQLDELAYF